MENETQIISETSENFESTEMTETVQSNEGAGDNESKDDRKLFVGALNYSSSEKNLKDYFSTFGEVQHVDIKVDQNTGKSKGFAFVTFAAADSIDKVLAVEEHTIDGRKVAPSKAKVRQGKIFVGGLKPELTNEEINAYFSSFGKIDEMQSPFDKQKNQRKNFCFIIFEKESVARSILKTLNHTISGHEVEVKKHTPKTDMFGGPRGGGRGGGRGGYGGGYGQDIYGGYGDYAGYDYGAGGNYGGYGSGYGGGYENYDYSSGYGSQSYGGGKVQRGVRKTRAPY